MTVYREVNEMPKCASLRQAPHRRRHPDGAARPPGRVLLRASASAIFDTYKQPKYGERALDGIPLVH